MLHQKLSKRPRVIKHVKTPIIVAHMKWLAQSLKEKSKTRKLCAVDVIQPSSNLKQLSSGKSYKDGKDWGFFFMSLSWSLVTNFEIWKKSVKNTIQLERYEASQMSKSKVETRPRSNHSQFDYLLVAFLRPFWFQYDAKVHLESRVVQAPAAWPPSTLLSLSLSLFCFFFFFLPLFAIWYLCRLWGQIRPVKMHGSMATYSFWSGQKVGVGFGSGANYTSSCLRTSLSIDSITPFLVHVFLYLEEIVLKGY